MSMSEEQQISLCKMLQQDTFLSLSLLQLAKPIFPSTMSSTFSSCGAGIHRHAHCGQCYLTLQLYTTGIGRGIGVFTIRGVGERAYLEEKKGYQGKCYHQW